MTADNIHYQQTHTTGNVNGNLSGIRLEMWIYTKE